MVGWKRVVCAAVASMLSVVGLAAPASAGGRSDQPGGVVAQVRPMGWEYLTQWAYFDAGSQLAALVQCISLGQANLDAGYAYDYRCVDVPTSPGRGNIQLWLLV